VFGQKEDLVKLKKETLTNTLNGLGYFRHRDKVIGGGKPKHGTGANPKKGSKREVNHLFHT